MTRETRGALAFVLKFVAFYIVANSIYGIYIYSCNPRADHITQSVSRQASGLLNLAGESSATKFNTKEPTVLIAHNQKNVLSVFEGCNGVNVLIVFVAFMLAYGGPFMKISLFIATGFIVIHVANLLRLFLLYRVALYHPDYFYYFHKYFFTIILYAIVFGLWVLWIMFNGKSKRQLVSQ